MSQAPLHAEAAGAGSPDAAQQPPRASRGWLTPAGIVILLATVIGLGLRLLQLAIPGHLLGVTEYDDGVYLGAAIRLVGGVLPYRDFVLVQPPGIVLLMTPVAALGKLTGTDWAMGIGRLVTACAGAASVPLAGLLVRRRGLLAVIVTCGIMAVYPDAILAARTVLQEPWLVLFCLIGALAVFDDERLTARTGRLAWGGAAFGVAGAVKLWAIFPIAVVAVLCLPGIRRAAVYLGGVAAGFGVLVVPFAAMAPSSFYHGVFLAQVVRGDDARVPLNTRLADLSGIVSSTGTRVHVPIATAELAMTAIVGLVVLACAAATIVTRRPPPPLECFALVTAGLVFLSFLWPADFYYHYAGFFTPFLALSVALPAARLAGGLRQATGRRPLELAAAGVAAAAVLAMVAVQAHTEAKARPAPDPAADSRVFPPGACVLTDQVALTIVAGRFTSAVPGCPQIVDGFGTDLDLSHGRNGQTGAARTPAVRQVWDSAFRHAQYVWLSSAKSPADRRIAWTPALRAYLAQNFRLVPGHRLIYKRIHPLRFRAQPPGR